MSTDVTDLHIADRRVYRIKLADFLRKYVVAAKEVLPFMPAISKLQSPMISVTSAPTIRSVDTPKNYQNDFAFSVRNVVLYSRTSDVAWTTEMAENMLDLLEYQVSISLLLADMQSEAQGWESISRQGASTFEFLPQDGVSWITETIPVIMKVGESVS